MSPGADKVLIGGNMDFTGIQEHYWDVNTGNLVVIRDAQRDYEKALDAAEQVAIVNAGGLASVNRADFHGLSVIGFDEEEFHLPANLEDISEAGTIDFDYSEDPSEFEFTVMAILCIVHFYIGHIFVVESDATPERWRFSLKEARQATKLDIKLPMTEDQWSNGYAGEDLLLIQLHHRQVTNTIPRWRF